MLQGDEWHAPQDIPPLSPLLSRLSLDGVLIVMTIISVASKMHYHFNFLARKNMSDDK
jgi:hypothetical protein